MNNQKNMPLFNALKEYAASKPIVFDVPGHKMGKGMNEDFVSYLSPNLLSIDINSMKEMDNLSNPKGIIHEAEKLAASFFHADNAFFMVNGSTAGVQSMILSSCNPGDKILMPRNIHKSAINGVILAGVMPIFFDTVVDEGMGISLGSTPTSIIQTINNNLDAKAILILNPTYHGYTIDLPKVIDYAHSKNMVVLVDESHGTHFYINEDHGVPSMKYGADIATISMHKTGGSLTQSSILLHNEGLIHRSKIRSTINLMQTSSASYILMASLDAARHNLANNQERIKDKLQAIVNFANKELQEVENIKVILDNITNQDDVFHKDYTKLLIDVSDLGLTGYELVDILKQNYNIQAETGEFKVILFILTYADEKSDIIALKNAFIDISKRFKTNTPLDVSKFIIHQPQAVMTPRKAFFSETEEVALNESIGKICADHIMVYPPGIPLVIAGEVITEEIIEKYRALIKYGNQVIGSVSNGSELIIVVKE